MPPLLEIFKAPIRALCALVLLTVHSMLSPSSWQLYVDRILGFEQVKSRSSPGKQTLPFVQEPHMVKLRLRCRPGG